MGRLLTEAERSSGTVRSLRSAFAIGAGNVLTAWHCVREVGGQEAQLWLRMQPDSPGGSPVDVPVSYREHCVELDAAVLTVDAQRGGEVLRDRLDAVALPLGVTVAAHDRVRVAGHPERNPAPSCVVSTGVVETPEFQSTARRLIRALVTSFAAVSPESPSGMSGGPLLRADANGNETVVGFVSAYAERQDKRGTHTALGGVVLCGRIADLNKLLPSVAEALRATPPPQVDPATSEEELTTEAMKSLQPKLGASGAIPTRWTPSAIEKSLEHVISSPSADPRVVDGLRIAKAAARAKAVFVALGGREVEIGRLQGIYRREVGAWPSGGTADALLVEAADATLYEQRNGGHSPLSALARFLVAIATDQGVSTAENRELLDWLAACGHQAGDAHRYQAAHTDGGWLVVDLGDEPGPAAPPYPAQIRWTMVTGNEVMSRSVEAGATREGLLRALRQVFKEIPPTYPLIVDLAVPCALLTERIEYWPVREVDGELEAIAEECQPRFRWSSRRRPGPLHGRVVDRIRNANWDHLPDPLPVDLLEDETRLSAWAKADGTGAWIIAGLPAASSVRPLRWLLRAGHGFVVWLPGSGRDEDSLAVRLAAERLPSAARRYQLPDELPTLDDPPIVIWDDPRGRGGFALPPPMAAESC
ncbi:trypsin-like peptidase domain-containing protein [Actinoplanes ianthinogenes]|uniref:trypsin-like peptidase domain-containing protein n=1 Tax=Actinoplanes ianthinogenes TaxID=122358 RepID=UPI00166FFAC0|nr:trypsin-like peptidase domain-containing protein [Actinoplanes ianthinogenes]